jgi:hypothetical protein
MGVVCRLVKLACENSPISPAIRRIKRKLSGVYHAYLSGRVKALQRELSEIAEHNREYFTKRHHSPKEKAQHEELWERVYEIRAELYTLLERTAA